MIARLALVLGAIFAWPVMLAAALFMLLRTLYFLTVRVVIIGFVLRPARFAIRRFHA